MSSSLSHLASVEIAHGDTAIVAELELRVSPGRKGSHSINAPSDVDYYGEPPTVECIDGYTVIDEDGSERAAAPAEVAAIDAWLDTKAGRAWQRERAQEAVTEWDNCDDCGGEP